MNHIVFLVEDLSTKTFLEVFLSIHYSEIFSFEIIHFQGKPDMFKRLNGYLKGYRAWAPENYRYVVLLDRDAEDCLLLKNRLEAIVTECGMRSKRATMIGYNLFTWIATEEVEAWYFGSYVALKTAFPRLQDKSHTSKYRNPDAIAGGTWEALERELKLVGYYESGLLKVDLAKKMAQYISPTENTSTSFNGFIDRLNNFY